MHNRPPILQLLNIDVFGCLIDVISDVLFARLVVPFGVFVFVSVFCEYLDLSESDVNRLDALFKCCFYVVLHFVAFGLAEDPKDLELTVFLGDHLT